MRVLVVAGTNIVGGGEVSLLRVLPALRADHDVQIAMVAPDGGELAEHVDSLGCPLRVLEVDRTRHLGASRRAGAELVALARNADIVHANDVKAAVYTQLAALRARRRWVFRAHELLTGLTRFQQAMRFIRPTRVIANSMASREHAARFARWGPDRIDVVYPGVDADALEREGDRAKFRDEFGIDGDEVAVGIVGRFEPQKGFEDFIRAAAAVATDRPRTRFVVVGDVMGDAGTRREHGDLRGRYETLAATLGLGDRITFTGVRRDIADVMAGLDVYVMASTGEGFGLVLLEAMSLSRPVVCTDQGGSREIVVADESGLLVPPSAPDALAAAIGRLVDDPALRARYGAAGRARLDGRFGLADEAAGLSRAWHLAVASP